MKVEEIKQYCIEKHKACETYPFGDVPICYKLNGKIFAQVYPYEWDYKITLKCTKAVVGGNMKVTNEKVKEIMKTLGADLCGIATLDRCDSAPEGYHPTDVFPACKSVISFACRFPVGTLACTLYTGEKYNNTKDGYDSFKFLYRNGKIRSYVCTDSHQ